jgi:hypothetical protein
MGILSDLLGGFATDLYDEIPESITDLYTTDLEQIASPDMTFKPFTVTANTGNVSTTADGSTAFSLSPEQQALQQQLFSGAGSLFSNAAMSTAGREQEIYDRIRATQSPEEQRQRLMMEERLHNQGRLGVQTNMFGGTPEAFAMEQAQGEARNNAMLVAMQQAQAEQQQQATLGGQFMESSYLPQAQLLASLTPSLDVASMADVARRQQGEYDLETSLANLSGSLGQQAALGNLYGSMFSGAGGLLGSITGTTGDIAGEIIKKLPFSDIRLKENITKVGSLDSGIGLYTWSWNEEGKRLAGDTPTVGVLAQEVQQVMPEAVIRGDHGYLTVNYSKLI